MSKVRRYKANPKVSNPNPDAPKEIEYDPQEVINIFFSKEDCSKIPIIDNCEELRKNFANSMKGGCTPCKKRAMVHKYSKLIRNKLMGE